MAQRLRRKIEIIFAIGVLMIFAVLVVNYYFGFQKVLNICDEISQNIETRFEYLRSKKCSSNESLIDIPGGFLCKRDGVDNLAWESIYDNYPRSNDGVEIIYDFLDKGKVEEADRFLEEYFPVSRFEPWKIESALTWEEDPYNEKYWRFIFHSLRSTRHLLFAWKETGDEKYRDELIKVVDSYVSVGSEKDVTWADPHAVSFRAMVLTNVWWKLREQNALDVELSDKIIKSLRKHGEYLSDIKNYEPGNNHGVNESAALLLVALNYPELDQDGRWKRVAKERINKSLSRLVDEDGVLVENSPYYHFYTMEKFYQINKYAMKHGIHIRDDFLDVIKKMAIYGAYILRPDLGVPLTGASLQDQKELSGYLEEIAKENSQLMYVLTRGEKGEKPGQLNKHFSHSGQTVFRSDWSRGDEFEKDVHLFFDVGAYRTLHSDLDALNLTLFGNGDDLIVDSGLYSYEDGKDKTYFKGTSAHNTVTVGDSDQFPGTVKAGRMIEGNGFVQQSAFHSLYPGTTHYRNVALLGRDVVLVVDKLNSNEEQNYKQSFHIGPGLKSVENDMGVSITRETGDFAMGVYQVLDKDMSTKVGGSDDLVEGWCSERYEEKIPCDALIYEKEGKSVTFVTLFKIGREDEELIYQYDESSNNLDITFGNDSYSITVDSPEHIADVQIKRNTEKFETTEKKYNLSFDDSSQQWELFKEEGLIEKEYEVGEKEGKLSISGPEGMYFDLDIEGVEKYHSITNHVDTDIPVNTEEDIKIYEQEDYLPIYGYHHIFSNNDTINHPSSQILLKDFEKQIKYSTEVMGCRWYTFSDVMENYVLKEKKLPRRVCVLNFDDGWRNNYENAFPVINQYNAVASFYVVPQRLENGQYMTWQQVEELYENGNEIGSHTMNSGGLVTSDWNREELVFQINESKKYLENHGYGTVKTFAYPLGEWNDEIVEVVKESNYIAARDISKKNPWRDRRAVAASMDEEYIWHMSYYKPEQKTLEEIDRELGYNGWWQFEEGYEVASDYDGDVKTRSSIKPTSSSYATVSLPDPGDSITNKFIVSRDAIYTVEFLATKGVNVMIDDKGYSAEMIDEECIDISENGEKYCMSKFSAQLTEGAHTITVKSVSKKVRVDKFRMYRQGESKKSYSVVLSEHVEKDFDKLSAGSDDADQIRVDVEKQSINQPWVKVLLILGVIIITIGYIGYKKSYK